MFAQTKQYSGLCSPVAGGSGSCGFTWGIKVFYHVGGSVFGVCISCLTLRPYPVVATHHISHVRIAPAKGC